MTTTTMTPTKSLGRRLLTCGSIGLLLLVSGAHSFASQPRKTSPLTPDDPNASFSQSRRWAGLDPDGIGPEKIGMGEGMQGEPAQRRYTPPNRNSGSNNPGSNNWVNARNNGPPSQFERDQMEQHNRFQKNAVPFDPTTASRPLNQRQPRNNNNSNKPFDPTTSRRSNPSASSGPPNGRGASQFEQEQWMEHNRMRQNSRPFVPPRGSNGPPTGNQAPQGPPLMNWQQQRQQEREQQERQPFGQAYEDGPRQQGPPRGGGYQQQPGQGQSPFDQGWGGGDQNMNMNGGPGGFNPQQQGQGQSPFDQGWGGDQNMGMNAPGGFNPQQQQGQGQSPFDQGMFGDPNMNQPGGGGFPPQQPPFDQGWGGDQNMNQPFGGGRGQQGQQQPFDQQGGGWPNGGQNGGDNLRDAAPGRQGQSQQPFGNSPGRQQQQNSPFGNSPDRQQQQSPFGNNWEGDSRQSGRQGQQQSRNGNSSGRRQDQQQPPPFGNNGYQQRPPFGNGDQQQPPPFGNNGEQQRPPFGGNNNNQQQQPPFGGNNQQQQPPFGGSNQQQQPPFGGNNQQQQPPFGGNNQQQQPPFGGSNNQQQQPPFGSNPQQQPPFGGNNQQPGNNWEGGRRYSPPGQPPNGEGGRDPFPPRSQPPNNNWSSRRDSPPTVQTEPTTRRTSSPAQEMPPRQKRRRESPPKAPPQNNQDVPPNTLDEDLLIEHNRLRTNPQSYIPSLQALLARMDGDGNIPHGCGPHCTLHTEEGHAAVQEAIEFLYKQPAVDPLIYDPRLTMSAERHALDQSGGAIGHTGSDGTSPADRIEQVIEKSFATGENIAYGAEPIAQQVVQQLLIDDGVADRGHRTTLFSPDWTALGTASGPHTGFRTVYVMNYAKLPKDVAGYNSQLSLSNKGRVDLIALSVLNHGADLLDGRPLKPGESRRIDLPAGLSCCVDMEIHFGGEYEPLLWNDLYICDAEMTLEPNNHFTVKSN